jgi:hypothetical protein
MSVAEAFKRLSSPKDRLVPDGVENGGMGNRARQARQKRRPKGDGQGCNRRVIDPALDGSCELVELGKERAERPTYRGVAAVCAEGPPCLHQQRRVSAMGDDSKEQSPRRKRSTIASPAKASDHTLPKGLVSRKVSRAADPHTRPRRRRRL